MSDLLRTCLNMSRVLFSLGLSVTAFFLMSRWLWLICFTFACFSMVKTSIFIWLVATGSCYV